MERQELINEMMTLTGMRSYMRDAINAVFGAFIASCPELEAEMREKQSQFDIDDLVTDMAQLFRHYSDDDLAGLVVFYGSPLGKKMIGLQPTILREAMEIGHKYAERLALPEGHPLLQAN